MRVTLVPWICRTPSREVALERIVPLGLLSVSAALREQGHDPIIHDPNISGNPFDAHSQAKTILKKAPDAVGFSSAVGVHHYALAIAGEIKRRAPNTAVVFGGPHPSITDRELLANFPYVDYVIRGEGEISFPNLLKALSNKTDLNHVAGLTYRQLGKIVRTAGQPFIENMDDLPFPAYDLYPMRKVVDTFLPLEAGRGCPYGCVFCSSSALWARKPRVKSIGRILREIRLVRELTGLNTIYFRHDHLLLHKSWFVALCQALKDLERPVSWQCSARVDNIDESLLDLMAEAGCIAIEYGLETGSERIQKLIHKNLTRDNICRTVKATRKRNIAPVLFFMCGFPDEDMSDLRQTLDLMGHTALLCKSHGYLQLKQLIPFPGTPIVEQHGGTLFYDESRLPSQVLADYTDEFKQIAKQSPRLFPEFYYLENRHQMSLKDFRFAEDFATQFVNFYTQNFPHCIRWLLTVIDGALSLVADEVAEFPLIRILDKDVTLDERIMLFAEYLERVLLATHNGPLPAEALHELIQYEQIALGCRHRWVKRSSFTELLPEDKLTLSPNARLSVFNYDIDTVISAIGGGGAPHRVSEGSVTAFLAVSPTNVKTYRLPSDLLPLLEFLDGQRTLAHILSESGFEGAADPLAHLARLGILTWTQPSQRY